VGWRGNLGWEVGVELVIVFREANWPTCQKKDWASKGDKKKTLEKRMIALGDGPVKGGG